MTSRISLLLLCLPFCVFPQVVKKSQETVVAASGNDLQLSNALLSIKIDLQKGTYSVIDKKENVVVFDMARLSADGWNSPHTYGPTSIGKQKISWQQKAVVQSNLKGQ